MMTEAPAGLDGPVRTMPVMGLLLSVLGVGLLCGLLMLLLGQLMDLEARTVLSGIEGIGVVLAGGFTSIIVLAPWKPRTVGTWMTLWLASTVIRLLVTPLLGFLIYSATRPEPVPYVLCLAGAYLLTLVTEVWAISRSLHRQGS